jgi:hypothetical protein
LRYSEADGRLSSRVNNATCPFAPRAIAGGLCTSLTVAGLIGFLVLLQFCLIAMVRLQQLDR